VLSRPLSTPPTGHYRAGLTFLVKLCHRHGLFSGTHSCRLSCGENFLRPSPASGRGRGWPSTPSLTRVLPAIVAKPTAPGRLLVSKLNHWFCRVHESCSLATGAVAGELGVVGFFFVAALWAGIVPRFRLIHSLRSASERTSIWAVHIQTSCRAYWRDCGCGFPNTPGVAPNISAQFGCFIS
jgi:hypothetical protein